MSFQLGQQQATGPLTQSQSPDFSSSLGETANNALFQQQAPGFQSQFARTIESPNVDLTSGGGIPAGPTAPQPSIGGGGFSLGGPELQNPATDVGAAAQQGIGSLLTGATGGGGILAGIGAAANVAHGASQIGDSQADTIQGITTTLGGIGGSFFGPVGALVGSAGGRIAGAVYADYAEKNFGGGNPRKQQRDAIRDAFESKLGPERSFAGVRGSTLKIGETNNEANIPEDILAEAISLADPIAEAIAHEFQAISGGQAEVRQDIGAMLANAAGNGSLGQKDTINNLLSIASELGLDADGIRAGVAKSFANGDIDEHRMKVYALNIGKFTGSSAEEELANIRHFLNG